VQAAAQHLHGGDRAAPCMHVRGGARPRLVWLYELVGQACSSLPRSSELLGQAPFIREGATRPGSRLQDAGLDRPEALSGPILMCHLFSFRGLSWIRAHKSICWRLAHLSHLHEAECL
jgi:hypothetical protein